MESEAMPAEIPEVPAKKVFVKTDITIELDHAKRACFVLQQNRFDVVKGMTVKNNSDTEMLDVRLKIWSNPHFFKETYFSIAALGAGAQHQFQDIKIVLDYDYLASLEERVKTEIIIEAEVEGAFVKKEIFIIDVLAYDEWPGFEILPEYLAAFSTPKDPAVNVIISEAGQLLKAEGLSFDGYQSGDPNRVFKQLAAIYAVIKAKNLVYANPPASFERQGQKVRFPKIILDLGLGTCLDTAMLFCSCAEAVGINPVIFLITGHAFPGFWLEDSCFPECVGDDLSAVKKFMADGISKMTALESTLSTDGKTGYAGAVAAATARLEDGRGFMMYIDIKRARRGGILPLPVRYGSDGSYRVDREIYEAQREEIKSLRWGEEIEPEAQGLGDRFEKWKRDLLNITLRNPLINYKVNRAGIPLLNYELAETFNALAGGGQLSLAEHPRELKKISDITKLKNEGAIFERFIQEELADGRLRCVFESGEMNKRLTKMFRAARLALEETGARTLFLALGYLKWQDKDKPGIDRFSPIVLVPVELSRKSARAQFQLQQAEEPAQINLSLIEMLRSTFRIDASGLRALASGENGPDIPAILTHLAKLVLSQKGWEVIEAANFGSFNYSGFMLWHDLNSREKAVRSHPLTGSLIAGKLDKKLFEPAFAPSGNPHLYLPVDSDSSQTKATREASSGKTFVLFGPPGTGKSQTITNIIGNALAHGKKVLFVAEKAAALGVVKRRLEKLGLWDFCLELHSNKGKKKDFYEQFDKVLELAQNAKDVNYAETAGKLAAAEGELQSFAAAMNEKRPVGSSVFEAVNTLIEAGGAEDAIDVAHTDVSGAALEAGTDALKSLADIGAVLGEPVNSAFWHTSVTDYSFELQAAVDKRSHEITGNYEGFMQSYNRLAELVKPQKSAPDFAKFETINGVYDTLQSALYYAKKNGFLRFMATVFAKRHRAMRKNRLYGKLKALIKQKPGDAAEIFAGMERFIESERALSAKLGYGTAFQSSENHAFEIFCAAEGFASSLPSLRDACIYNENRKKCEQFPQLAEVVKAYHAGEVQSSEAVALFRRSFWQSWLVATVSADPVLKTFSPGAYATKRERFRAFTELVTDITKKEIYLKMAEGLPNFQFASAASSEPGILMRAVKNRGRGISIRSLFERIPELIRKVKPCMLMSPLSAAQYLPSDFPGFDMVVFDEASQLKTCEAVGAVARGAATVVVGDPKQLPPTTFFNAGQGEGETDFELMDQDSVLDEMLALNIPQHRLLWHYRSEHESLIAFSNVNYNENSLITFLSPDDTHCRVEFRKVEGVYDRGKTRTNPKEAEAVVEELFKLLRDPDTRNLSYGIVTFNITQQNLIEDLIDKRLSAEPQLERFFTGGESPVFIKNIESVQGDERDVIIFSVTYGTDKDGRMTVNFGPINQDGGWRRLNVAITRACKRVLIFSTVRPEQIDTSRTSALGVKGLKDFMSFALNPDAYFTRHPSAPCSPFVASVADALKSAGFKVSANTGRSANKIDVAVSDASGRYIAGIICDDGGMPHNRAARDREYGRESFYRRMGWNLTRVYAVEWWQNRAAEARRLIHFARGGRDSVARVGAESKEVIAAEIEKNTVEISFNPDIPLPQIPYKAADLGNPREPDELYAYANAALAAAQVKKIIDTEGPISDQALYRKIAAAWSVSRMGQKFNDLVGQLVERLNPVSNTTQSRKFFWRAKPDIDMKNFRTNEAGRKPEDICKEEYAVAALYVLKCVGSIGAEDLTRETARLFGSAKTPAAAMRIGYALSLLVS
ncbi:MAG: DUF3320 domain-containing protein, partial [Firmicutes bacterium]|nr:DUF3320 domain-containing protein [Bacillota bacterium]